jgi:integrase
MAKISRNLTDAAIRKLKPAKKKRANGTTYYETVKTIGYGIPGLSIRATERRKTFRLTYKLRGKTSLYTLGDYPALSLENALTMAQELRKLVLAGIDPKRHNGALTLSEAVAEFIEKHCIGINRDEPRNRTWKEQKRQLEYFTSELGECSLREITRDDVAPILERIAQRAPGHHDRVRAAAHKFFRWAVSHGRCESNPIAATPRVHTAKKRTRFLEFDEIPAMWKAAERLRSPRADVLKLLLLTGCRLKEISALRWSEVKLETGELHLPAERVKNKQPHTVYLSDAARTVLSDVRKSSEFVFPGEAGGPVTFGGRVRERLMKHSGLEHWTPHDLRRTHAVLAGRCGMPVHIIERALNHKSGTYAGIVGNYQVDEHKPERRQCAELVGQLVEDILAGKQSKLLRFDTRAA